MYITEINKTLILELSKWLNYNHIFSGKALIAFHTFMRAFSRDGRQYKYIFLKCLIREPPWLSSNFEHYKIKSFLSSRQEGRVVMAHINFCDTRAHCVSVSIMIMSNIVGWNAPRIMASHNKRPSGLTLSWHSRQHEPLPGRNSSHPHTLKDGIIWHYAAVVLQWGCVVNRMPVLFTPCSE